MAIFGKFKGAPGQDSEHWMGVSDLMAGLMMVFLFISVVFMRQAAMDRSSVVDIVTTFKDTQVAIYDGLYSEFEQDLEKWNAEIDKETLEFRFKSPDVLFAVNEIEVQERFQEILNDFFPRYLAVLQNYEDYIKEVRIEGHTDSSWGSASPTDAYFNNMELSQGRTRSVLSYVYGLLNREQQKQNWVKSKVAAVGFSSSRPAFDKQGDYSPELSRRVVFKVVTNADEQIARILAEVDGN